MSDETRVFRADEEGDQQPADELLPLVYEELRRLAKTRLCKEQPGQTLQATDLVHEAYQRLINVDGGDAAKWNSAGHFFGAAAEAMRRILIERARAKAAQKRGGNMKRVEFDGIDHPAANKPERLIQLDDALARFEKVDPQKAKLVKLKYFAQLSNRQTADVLGISSATVDRHWAFARAWLKADMDQHVESGSEVNLS